MSPTSEELLKSAMTLSDTDRLELVEALIVSLQPTDEFPFDASWREIIQKRSAELQSGSQTPLPWEQVKQQAREKLGGQI
jgi:putative addiction module component (TIGR02574 family)